MFGMFPVATLRHLRGPVQEASEKLVRFKYNSFILFVVEMNATFIHLFYLLFYSPVATLRHFCGPVQEAAANPAQDGDRHGAGHGHVQAHVAIGGPEDHGRDQESGGQWRAFVG